MSFDSVLHVPSGGSMVLFRQWDVTYDRQDCAHRLAALANVPVYDALNILAHHHGAILAEHLEPGVASRFAEELQRAGLPATVLHAADQIVPVYVGHVLNITYGSECLHVGTERGPVEVPWSRVEVLSVGQVDIVKEHHVDMLGDRISQMGNTLMGSAYGGHAPSPTALPVSVKQTEKQLMVEVYTSDRGQVLPMVPKTMTYTHLGPRMLPSSTENMRLTLRDLISHAPTAARNHAVEKFVGGAMLGTIHCPSLETFQQESLWLLQARRQGWLGGTIPRSGNCFDALEL